MRLPTNKKIIYWVLAVSFIVLFFFWFVFFLQISRVRELSELNEKEKLNTLVLRKKMEELSKLKNEISDLGDEKKKFEALFIKENEAVPLLRLLEKIAAETNCVIKISPFDISKIKFEKAVKSENIQDGEEEIKKPKPQEVDQAKEQKDDLAPLKKYPAFSVEAEGAYGSTVSFLKKMENLPYFIRVLILDIAPMEKASQSSSSGSGVLQTSSQQKGGDQPSGDKNVKMSITFVVYGN